MVLDIEEEKAIESQNLIVLQGVLAPVTLATWSPACSVAHLIEYISPHFLFSGKLFYSASD